MSESAGQASDLRSGGNGARYLDAQQRILALAADVADDQPIAATPDWTFLDLLKHLDGVAADVVAGNIGQYSQPDWTRAQVERWSGQPRAHVLAAWTERGPRLAAVLDDPATRELDPMFNVLPLVDALAHEHDIREAVHRPAVLDPDDWSVVEPRRREILDICIRSAALPALQVTTPEGDEWVVGGDEPVVAVRAARHDLWRSLQGRRTRTEVLGFTWTADPDPYLELWPGFVFSWPEG